MAEVTVIRVEPQRMKTLREELGNEDTPRVYNDSNVLVRELFWRRFEALLALSAVPERRRVLDFGGGNGVLMPTISRLYQEVTCVDLRTEMAQEIVRSEHLENVQLHSADLASLALPDASFDTIIAADVLEHILDLDDLIQEFQRLLVPGGELLVSAPTENAFYRLGRLVFRYEKPDDHYHESAFIESTVGHRLPMAKRRFFPVNVQPLGVFSLGRYVRGEA